MSETTIVLPRPAEALAEVERTLVFVDIVGSTRLVDAIGDVAWAHLLSWHERTLEALFEHHGGELVDQAGDGFFVSVEEACAAIHCAVAIQRTLDRHRRVNGFALEVSIGVHRASVLRSGRAYRGKGVHVAARIAALATAGEILVSLATVASRDDVSTFGLRTVELEGISEPIELQAIDWTQIPSALQA